MLGGKGFGRGLITAKSMASPFKSFCYVVVQWFAEKLELQYNMYIYNNIYKIIYTNIYSSYYIL
jgi:hypothetical protein